MFFSNVIGQDFIKKHLTQSADQGRIPHAQLFVGKAGSGILPMAIAYAQYIICGNIGGENNGENGSCNLSLSNSVILTYILPILWQKHLMLKKNPSLRILHESGEVLLLTIAMDHSLSGINTLG